MATQDDKVTKQLKKPMEARSRSMETEPGRCWDACHPRVSTPKWMLVSVTPKPGLATTCRAADRKPLLPGLSSYRLWIHPLKPASLFPPSCCYSRPFLGCRGLKQFSHCTLGTQVQGWGAWGFQLLSVFATSWLPKLPSVLPVPGILY